MADAPPCVAARVELGSRWEPVLDEVVTYATPVPSGLRLDGEYLLVTATRT